MILKQFGEWTLPLLEEHESLTDEYVNQHLSPAIQSDGCTLVSELYHECCVVHDLGYRFCIDPWGRSVSKHEVDVAFRRCMETRSKLGRFAPIAWGRYAVVCLFGRFFRHPRVKCNESAAKDAASSMGDPL